MKTDEIKATSQPEDDIDPKLKDENWILRNVKWRWEQSRQYCGNVMWHGREAIANMRTYMHGWQNVDTAKRQMLSDEQVDNSWINIDWSPRPLMTTYIEKAVAKILQRDFNIVCTAINEQARTDQDSFYNKQRIKLLMREALQKTNPKLLDNPALRLNPTEPQSLAELDMYMQYGYKHAMSMYGEMSVQMSFAENDIYSKRKDVVTDQVGIGLGGYKDWTDNNGKSRFRAVRPENMVFSYCKEKTFEDAVHAGEVVRKTFGQIARYFDKMTLKNIKEQSAGQWGNPSIDDTRWSTSASNDFVCYVWDVEFFSYNESQYEMSVDKHGNLKSSKISYNAKPEERIKNQKAKGIEPSQYERDCDEVVYKTCWIIGTDYQYDCGLATNQKRNASDPRRTYLSYHMEAWNFNDMVFAGLGERLKPYQEEYQLVQFKLANFRNKWIPYIIKIDVAALEKTAMKGKGSKEMTPLQLLDFMFQQHILLIRQDALGEGANPNYKPIDIIHTEMAEEFEVLFKDMERINQMMQMICGFNTVSAGGNVDPRMLSDGYAASLAGTMDSLFLITESDKKLLTRLATGILQRQQIAVQLGKVEGYVNVIGPAGVKFMKIDPGISMFDYGIYADDKPDAAKRQAFLEKLDVDTQNGLILPQDLIMIENCSNLKQAEMLLAFRIDQRKKENVQNDQNSQQMQQQGSVASAQMAGQIAEAAADKQLDRDIKKINAEKQWDYIIQGVKTQGTSQDAQLHAQSKLLAQQMIEDSKRMTPAK